MDVRLIKLIWENEKVFKLETKLNDENWLTVLHMDENGELPELWENAQKVCEKFFARKISDIGNEMKEKKE